MATKSDFTEQEWETLEKGLMGAGLLVSLSDRGFFDAFKEAGALAKHLSNARQSQSSELVRELGETRGTGFGLGASPSEVESEALESLRSAVETLQAKAPEDIEPYRQLVLEVAESVGRAASGGETVEAGALDRIRTALGSSVAA